MEGGLGLTPGGTIRWAVEAAGEDGEIGQWRLTPINGMMAGLDWLRSPYWIG